MIVKIRDVSAPNVLLKALPNGMWRGKVSDFGFANLARFSVTAGEGAIIYTAPEAFPQRNPNTPRVPHTVKIDVYSFPPTGSNHCCTARSRQVPGEVEDS